MEADEIAMVEETKATPEPEAAPAAAVVSSPTPEHEAPQPVHEEPQHVPQKEEVLEKPSVCHG